MRASTAASLIGAAVLSTLVYPIARPAAARRRAGRGRRERGPQPGGRRAVSHGLAPRRFLRARLWLASAMWVPVLATNVVAIALALGAAGPRRAPRGERQPADRRRGRAADLRRAGRRHDHVHRHHLLGGLRRRADPDVLVLAAARGAAAARPGRDRRPRPPHRDRHLRAVRARGDRRPELDRTGHAVRPGGHGDLRARPARRHARRVRRARAAGVRAHADRRDLPRAHAPGHRRDRRRPSARVRERRSGRGDRGRPRRRGRRPRRAARRRRGDRSCARCCASRDETGGFVEVAPDGRPVRGSGHAGRCASTAATASGPRPARGGSSSSRASARSTRTRPSCCGCWSTSRSARCRLPSTIRPPPSRPWTGSRGCSSSSTAAHPAPDRSCSTATASRAGCVPAPTWTDYLELAITEIRHYGGGSMQVGRRLHALYDHLLAELDEAARARIELERRLLDARRREELPRRGGPGPRRARRPPRPRRSGLALSSSHTSRRATPPGPPSPRPAR